MTWTLIGANVFVFLIEISLPAHQLEAVFYWFGLVPARYTHPEWARYVGLPLDTYWPFLTNMFLHGSFAHLLGNMWTLWIFGDNVEDRMGPVRFLIFYLLCGVAAGVVHSLVNPASTVPAVGASGAISGVLGAYFLLFPRSHIIMLFPVFFLPYFFTLPASVYLLFWFLAQFFSGTVALFGPENVGGIAWWAHVGGFAAGVVLHRLFLLPAACRRCYRDQYPYRSAWDLPL